MGGGLPPDIAADRNQSTRSSHSRPLRISSNDYSSARGCCAPIGTRLRTSHQPIRVRVCPWPASDEVRRCGKGLHGCNSPVSSLSQSGQVAQNRDYSDSEILVTVLSLFSIFQFISFVRAFCEAFRTRTGAAARHTATRRTHHPARAASRFPEPCLKTPAQDARGPQEAPERTQDDLKNQPGQKDAVPIATISRSGRLASCIWRRLKLGIRDANMRKPPVGIEPTTVRLRSACSAN